VSGIQLYAPPNTVQIILETVFTASHSTVTDKTKQHHLVVPKLQQKHNMLLWICHLFWHSARKWGELWYSSRAGSETG